MSDDMAKRQRRLVVGHKSADHSFYDVKVKSEQVLQCLQSGTSVSRLA
jgi:hypothetical protein